MQLRYDKIPQQRDSLGYLSAHAVNLIHHHSVANDLDTDIGILILLQDV